MDTGEFWQLIATARTGLTGHDSGDQIAAALVILLATRDPEAILDFEDHFDQAMLQLYRWDIWAAAYLIRGGCSDDSFTDFRAGVISLGRDWHERVLANPDSLADHRQVQAAATGGGHDEALFAESVNYVAYKA